MIMKKKFLSIALGTVMIAGVISGCASTGSDTGSETQTSTETQTEIGTSEETATTEVTSEETESTGDTLIVYYSAQGHTVEFAEAIADELGADLFEIVPTEVYTEDDLNWADDDSRVSKEYADESLRDVELTTTEVENWENYDIVYIGYPIWWGIAAWPVNTFVEANDFTGKTVIPFCTSSSSGIGQSGEILAELAGTGTWLDGERFQSNQSTDDAREWVAAQTE